MTPRTSRPNRNPSFFWSFALLAGLSGTVAKADPLYTVTNLGSGVINLATVSGGTIAVSAGGLPFGSSFATSQLVSVSNGQVSYSFSTTPETMLIQGQGALSNVPLNLDSGALTGPFGYSGPDVSGFSNVNGYAAVVVSYQIASYGNDALQFATINPIGSNGEVNWSQGASIMSSPNNGLDGGYIAITGINTANQVLVGTSFGTMPYDALVYSLSSKSVTDLDTLPAITAGGYSNLEPFAIDDQGQVLVTAQLDTPTGPVFDTLLLTPSGEPIVTAPEPSTCITWALIAGASWIAAKRRRRRA
jgi:hypothetical protein